MCTVFGDIWFKYAGIGAKSVFLKKILNILAQMGVACVDKCVMDMVQGIQGKFYLILRPMVQEL